MTKKYWAYSFFVVVTPLAGILLWQFPHSRFRTGDTIDVSLNGCKP